VSDHEDNTTVNSDSINPLKSVFKTFAFIHDEEEIEKIRIANDLSYAGAMNERKGMILGQVIPQGTVEDWQEGEPLFTAGALKVDIWGVYIENEYAVRIQEIMNEYREELKRREREAQS
jgi:hypothetical protein